MDAGARHDPANQRFVIPLGADEATLDYAHAGAKTLDYRSTFVPVKERGRGIGERLVRDALDWAREHHYSVIPSCPFVRTVAKRHPEYRDVVIQK